jgi:hypothetical protein
MALPGDVTTTTVTFGPYTDATGAIALVGATGKLFPVDPSTNKRVRVIDIASGQVVVPEDVKVTIASNGTASAGPIPRTGQSTLSPAGFAWRMEWDIPSGSRSVSPGNLTFVAPSGSTTDFDLLVPAATIPAVAISQPTVATVNGKTGAVTLNAADVGADAAGAATAAQAAAILYASTGLGGKQDKSTLGADVAADATVKATFGRLTPTATKTAAYTAAVGDLAMMNVAGGATALTLPSAPADKAQVGYRAIGATNTTPLTINRGGSDTIGTAGATSASIPLADETVIVQYDAANTRWLQIANARTQASVDARYVKQDVGSQALPQRVRRFSALPAQPIASNGTGTHSAGVAGTATTGYSNRNVYKAAVACTDIQVVFTLGYLLGAGGSVAEIVSGTATTGFKAALETSDGTIYPLFFKGTRLGSADQWGQIVTDPLGIELAAGDVFYVRTFIPAATGSGIFWMQGPNGYGPGITASGTTGQSSAGDTVDSGGTYSNGSQLAYNTGLVCGQPTGGPAPTIAVVGDSITHGQGSTNACYAWWKYGFNNAFPTIQYSKPGILAQGIAANHKRGFPLFTGCSHALVLLGTNDFQGRTLVQMQTDLLTIWNALAARGMRVFAATIPPLTTSTDSWATTTNQTKKPTEGVRTGFNDWIRTTPAPLTGYFETADACETSRNSGLWKVNGTANYATVDGTHPSDLSHQAMGATINTALITV